MSTAGMSADSLFGIVDRERIPGVVIGIVTDNKDPDGMYRVKVKFPWLSDSSSGGDFETDWCRVTTFMSGTEWGAFYMPEVNDEVLVAFMYGDVRAPFVIGSLFNGNEKPVHADVGGNDKRTIKSRSGHILEFNDGGEPSVHLTTAAGHHLLLDEANDKIELYDDDGANKLTIDSGGSKVSLESADKILLKSGGNTDIEVGGNLTIKVSGTTNFETSGAKTIKSSATMNVEASAVMTIKGSVVNIN